MKPGPRTLIAAIAWVRANIGLRGGNPGSLFLLGHSSGAMLVALVGADDRFLTQLGLATADVRGVVAMGSIMWDDDLEQTIARYGRGRVDSAFRRQPDNARSGIRPSTRCFPGVRITARFTRSAKRATRCSR